MDLSGNYITDQGGVKLAEGLLHNECLHVLILKENTLGEKSGHAFLEAVKVHPAIKRLDISQNLVNFKFINMINSYTQVNASRGDNTLLPNLKREYKLAKRVKQSGNVYEIHDKINEIKENRDQMLQDCEKLKRLFWRIYKQENEKYDKLKAELARLTEVNVQLKDKVQGVKDKAQSIRNEMYY